VLFRSKNIEKKIPEINSLLEDIGLGTLLSVGASIALPALGLAIIPGIIVFGSASWLMKKIKDEIKGKN
jgi:hypothetical protein